MITKVYQKYLKDKKVVIFLFHGVIESNKNQIRNYNKKHILSNQFEKILKSLLRKGTPVSMDDVINFCNGKKIPTKPFAITFDDGFQNNLRIALPILEKLKIPATIYITTNFIEKNLMSWIDRIEWAFEKKKNFNIYLPWRSKSIKISTVKKKIDILNEIRKKVKSNHTIDPKLLADNIQLQLKLPKKISNNTQIDKKLSWKEIKTLNSNSLITIGGHTHNHSILSYIDQKNLKKEISYSLKLLRIKAGVATKHFSYPEGTKISYNKFVIQELKNNGIQCCPTAVHGLNQVGSNLFELKRIFVI